MNRQTLQSIARRVLPWVSALAVSGLSLTLAQDLPFSSGSTGADGPLTFRKVIVGGRSYQAAAFDRVRNQLVVFGGTAANGDQGDTWVWDGNDWVRKNPASSPLPRTGVRMVWDDTRKEIVLFGGNRQGTRLADTWTWDGVNWTQKNPATSPTARDYHAMAWDGARQRVVLHGGNGGADETWLWDGTNWTQVNPLTKPPGHSNHALAYDAARQKVVLFGAYGQTWLWDGNNWAQAQPAFSPVARNYLAMDYDSVRQEVVLQGGSSRDDTWAWNGTTWTQRTPANTPGTRNGHALVWDPVRNNLVLFGGDSGADNSSGDTWFWNGTDWAFWSGKTQTFDLSSRANGIYNYTTIEVPSGITVRFKKNAGNTPVRWLASDMVTINGVVDVSGEFAPNSLAPGVVARGGPGGYDGGRGGVNFTASSSYVGTAGHGAGWRRSRHRAADQPHQPAGRPARAVLGSLRQRLSPAVVGRLRRRWRRFEPELGRWPWRRRWWRHHDLLLPRHCPQRQDQRQRRRLAVVGRQHRWSWFRRCDPAARGSHQWPGHR